MKDLFIAIRVLLNIVLWSLYSLVGIILGDAIFAGGIPVLLDKPVTSSSNPIHLKIAVVVLLIITILTIVFRKYFYLNLKNGKIWR